jgi:hypothetical protein
MGGGNLEHEYAAGSLKQKRLLAGGGPHTAE